MKKLLYSAAALALVFFAGSCQRENLEPVAANGTVTYTVEVPGAMATKAADGVNNVNELVYEVYRTVGEEVTSFTDADNLLYHRTAPIVNGVAEFSLEFVNDQNFTVLFWAHQKDNGVYDVRDLKSVKVASAAVANTHSTAAFTGIDFVKECVSVKGGNVKLVRPVGQLRIATTPESLRMDNTVITVTRSSAKVYGLSTTFNVAEQEAGDATFDVEYTEADRPEGTVKVGTEDYPLLAMNYIGFIPTVGANVKVDYVLQTSEGIIDYTVENVPVKPNYRTNIIGNLISGTTDYNVTLDAEWVPEEEEVEIWDGKTLAAPAVNAAGEYEVTKPSEWAYLANAQNPSTRAQAAPVVINLTSDLDFGGNALTGLAVERGNSLTVKGNGYTVKNARMVTGDNDNGTPCASLFVNLPTSVLTVSDLDIENVNVVVDQDPEHGYAAVLVAYAEGDVTLENIKVSNSTVYGTHSIGTAVGFLAGTSSVEIKNFTADGIKLSNADVAGESGSMGGFVGRVAGILTADNVKVSNSTIEAYVATASEQKRSIAKFIGNFVGGGTVNVTGASIENVTIVAKNELAETQQCLYTEYLGGWRGNGGTVSINGIEITKDQTNDDITIDTPAEFATAISNAADGAVIPVSGEIPTSSLSASGKSITIVGMSDDATINSASARMETYGNITFQNVTIKLPTNNDYYGGQDAHNAQIVYDNCKFVGTATAINGTFVYNDCEFTNPDKYAAWVYNGNVTYNNCSFTGKDRAAKVYAEAGNAPVVTYNNCTFNAAQSVNKTAVEIDCTNQTSGTPYYVTIINPTINNMGVAEHYAIGEGVCNLETSGHGLGIVNLNGKSYSVANTTAQLQALAWAVKEEMGVTTVEVADGTYSDDITLTVAAATKTAAGDLVFKAAEGTSPVIAGTVTLGYRNQGVGAAMWNCAITFDGITFDHANAATHSLDVQDVKSLTLKNCKIIGDGEYGLTSARGNATGESSIVGCTFENAAMQLLGNFATGLVIDGCTFNESRINVQAGNGVTVKNCDFTGTLTSANVDDSFYLIRSNSTPITVKGCNMAIDSELAEVVTTEQAKWYILANRGTTDWTVENVAVTMTEAALKQTQLKVTACTSTGKINTTNLTVNGNVQ